MAGDFEARVEWRINGLPSFAEPRLLFRAQDPARCDDAVAASRRRRRAGTVI